MGRKATPEEAARTAQLTQITTRLIGEIEKDSPVTDANLSAVLARLTPLLAEGIRVDPIREMNGWYRFVFVHPKAA